MTRRQLLDAGLTAGEIKHRLATGRLIPVYRGVFAAGHDAISPLGRICAGLLAAGPAAAAGYSSAPFLHRLTPTLPAVIEVTSLANARRSRGGLVIHETTRPFAVVTIAGLRVTTPLRTLEDLRWDDGLVREALARGLVRLEQLPVRLEDIPTKSQLENRMRRLCRAAGLPLPRGQHAVGRYVIDFAWPEQRVLVETDDWRTHGRRQAFEDDRARDADLISRGYVVLRFTWRQITESPYRVAAQLAAALALNASTPVAP